MELFGTAGIRGSVTERVTPELALDVGRAAGLAALESDSSAEFVVGRDGRTSGQGLAAAVEAGLLSAGADVTRVGVVPTPALAFASQGRRGIMLTASHNPPTDNGIKMFVDGEEYDRDLERGIETRVESSANPVEWDHWGARGTSGVLDDYRETIVDFASEHGSDLDGLRVAVDCGNGMSALGTPQVLRDLGAHVVTLNAQIDGHFPGRESKPTPETLMDLRAFVAEGDFDFGIGHDGDSDRIVIIDDEGEIVHEDTIIAIVAEHYVRVSDVSDPVIVTTPNASGRIDERVREAGGRVERVRLGALHEGIASARADGGDVVFAAEPWKHIHPSLGGWIDGVASAALIARLAAESGMDGLREPVTERPYRKVSVSCPDEKKAVAMAALETSLPDAMDPESVDTEYGVRLEFADASWTLVRPSGTEPYIRVYAEADDVDALVDEVTTVVEAEIEHA
ncbi:phosphopentomutase/phosphoglucosamine mutase [Haloferax mediterranei ATCC 33500]|uniref:Phosphomannomutase n=1 Tax=Haloferax mediterranei (strain ATCC 33500 / DSM 1411 / JCM 8866 / NBRC 14739 / NCIMB 2177 / R-4) TaxID=523841 RepID=I3R4M6_HALMT|nr:phosphopentomutase/phosphoglucosamine mutase [Haloferax mediterranei]AFK19186.1 phosphohexomutase (phosphoglucomutase,phosphomannomutase) [Haloferax mediterranei ATCC 33500]AHZ21452.1 phosphomannomutase [Haloferax mediterranei ATCC 33500]EMA03911.1 phosphohexomutase (phosphoglucomutase,phosphomannomutase) [Haloferax mediterranei ATCC 33500]MDX5989285.1 phosphopentomutase/phosphoglucosamine mutase [Haloferax mediterranei ATCC 33500]QCQ75656.1 phosphopentomutase/phosphoglucosamine mutase [Hal